MSAASRETECSRYKASGNAAPATSSNVSAASHTIGSRHTRRPLDVPRGRFANTTSSLPASSCSISGELRPIWTSSFTFGCDRANRPSADRKHPPPPPRPHPGGGGGEGGGGGGGGGAASSSCSRRRASPSSIS